MAWTDGIDRATNYIISAVNWNALLGAAGSLMQLKSHQHGGTTGEGSQSLGPLVLEDFTDAAAPAAPGAGKTRVYAVSGKPRYRAGAGGTDRALITDETTASGDLASTFPAPTLAKITLGSDADGDIYYRAGGVLARLAKGGALQVLRMNAGATAPEWVGAGASLVSRYLNVAALNIINTALGTYVDFGGSFTTAVTTATGDKVCIRVHTSIRKLTAGLAAVVIDRGGTKLPAAGGLSSVNATAIGSWVPMTLEYWDTPAAGTYTYKPQLFTDDANQAEAGGLHFCQFVVELWR